MSTDSVVIEKEMAVTHADFFRSLPNALDGEECKISGTKIEIKSDAGLWTIELGPEGERRIALLSVPVTPVKLTFNGFEDDVRIDALDRFDRAFQRGGG